MAASLSSFSSLSIRTSNLPRHSLLPPKPSLSLFSKPQISLKLKASADPKSDEWLYNPENEPEEIEDFSDEPYFDEREPETEEQVAARYEEEYGTAYSGVSVLGNDVEEEEGEERESSMGIQERPRFKDDFEETIVQVKRVTKVVKGGKKMSFRAVVVVGDKKGQVGVGIGKANEIADAVYKAVVNARRNVVTVPLTKYSTFPHRAYGVSGAAKVMLRPACPGSGVIAGGSVRIVLEMAGVENALGKQLRSKNALNNARATIVAVQSMRQFREVAEARGLPMELLWQ